MTVDDVYRLQKMIAEAEIQLAKKQGQLEALLSEMQKEFGTSDMEKINEERSRLEQEQEKIEQREKKLLSDLENICDWKEIENLLCQ